MKPLKHETDAVSPQQGATRRVQHGHVLAKQFHAALVGGQDAAENGQERRLAAARRAGQVRALAAADGQIDAVQHGRRSGAAAVDFGNAFQADGRRPGVLGRMGVHDCSTISGSSLRIRA